MAATVFAVCSDMPRRFRFAGVLLLLAAQRLLMQGGFGLLLDVQLLAAVAWIAFCAIIKTRKGNPAQEQASTGKDTARPGIA